MESLIQSTNTYAPLVLLIMGIFGLFFLVIQLLALIDSIRDRNLMGFLVVFFMPGLGTIIYWLFLNEK